MLKIPIACNVMHCVGQANEPQIETALLQAQVAVRLPSISPRPQGPVIHPVGMALLIAVTAIELYQSRKTTTPEVPRATLQLPPLPSTNDLRIRLMGVSTVVSDAVPLPEDVTETTASLAALNGDEGGRFVDEVDAVLASGASGISLNPADLMRLKQMIESVRRGREPHMSLVRLLWELRETQYLDGVRATGAKVTRVQKYGKDYWEIRYYSRKQYTYLHILQRVMAAIDAVGIDRIQLVSSRQAYSDKPGWIRLPTLSTLLSVLGDQQANVVWIAHGINRDDVYQFFKMEKVPVQISLNQMVYLSDFKTTVPSFVFAWHDIFHAVAYFSMPDQIKDLVSSLYSVLESSCGTNCPQLIEGLLEKLIQIDLNEYTSQSVRIFLEMNLSAITAEVLLRTDLVEMQALLKFLININGKIDSLVIPSSDKTFRIKLQQSLAHLIRGLELQIGGR